MSETYMACVKFAEQSIPLTDQDRQAVIQWFEQMAEEYRRGEHYGERFLYLGRRAPTQDYAKRPKGEQ